MIIKAIAIGLTFIIGGICIVMSEVEDCKRTRFVFLFIGNMLFLVSGILIGISY